MLSKIGTLSSLLLRNNILVWYVIIDFLTAAIVAIVIKIVLKIMEMVIFSKSDSTFVFILVRRRLA